MKEIATICRSSNKGLQLPLGYVPKIQALGNLDEYTVYLVHEGDL